MQRRHFLSGFWGLAGFYLPAARTETKTAATVLLETHIAGYQYYSGDQVESFIQPGDRLKLACEFDNPYDSKAIQIFWRQTKLGYIPRRYNGVIAQMMHRGTRLNASVLTLTSAQLSWRRLRFNVFL